MKQQTYSKGDRLRLLRDIDTIHGIKFTIGTCFTILETPETDPDEFGDYYLKADRVNPDYVDAVAKIPHDQRPSSFPYGPWNLGITPDSMGKYFEHIEAHNDES